MLCNACVADVRGAFLGTIISSLRRDACPSLPLFRNAVASVKPSDLSPHASVRLRNHSTSLNRNVELRGSKVTSGLKRGSATVVQSRYTSSTIASHPKADAATVPDYYVGSNNAKKHSTPRRPRKREDEYAVAAVRSKKATDTVGGPASRKRGERDAKRSGKFKDLKTNRGPANSSKDVTKVQQNEVEPDTDTIVDEGVVEPKGRLPWQTQKESLKKKLGGAVWEPRRRLSPDALEGIRALHAQSPTQFTTPILAKQFEVSPEVIRRILKSKWKPTEEEQEKRRVRWDKRGERIWTKWAKTGLKPPKKWRERRINEPPPGRLPKWLELKLKNKAARQAAREAEREEASQNAEPAEKKKRVPRSWTGSFEDSRTPRDDGLPHVML